MGTDVHEYPLLINEEAQSDRGVWQPPARPVCVCVLLGHLCLVCGVIIIISVMVCSFPYVFH